MSPGFKDYPFEFIRRRSAPPQSSGGQERCTVAIVGGGVTGLTAALALAAQGVASIVIEADDTVCYGSRAICFSRRTLEIFDRIGVLGPILEKGLAWEGGRSFYRDREVLHFRMPHDENQKLPPMINIQQYYVEEHLVRAAERSGGLVEIRWGSRVTGVETGVEAGQAAEAPEAPEAAGAAGATQAAGQPVQLLVQHGQSGAQYRIAADYVIACDGGRSAMRDLLGLHLQGTAYEGRYVIADIELQTALPTERLAWFDPPSNPGSTILMHRQPDHIWRIDYQLREDEDPEQAVRPENVLPRIQAHLAMMGETGPWSPLWISVYKANALSLARYRHGRIFFAGDAAHLVPIFGVRGANSSIDDADNLAWKLALAIGGKAGAGLLESYSHERVAAARENLGSGMKSTEFMAPPSFAFRLMREAVLGLAPGTPAVRSLINPRQTSAIRYGDSPLNAADSEDGTFSCGPAAGSVLASVPVTWLRPGQAAAAAFLSDLAMAGRFLVLHFCGARGSPQQYRQAVDAMRGAGIPVELLPVVLAMPVHEAAILDPGGKAHRIYDAAEGAVYLARPDGHVLGRWRVPPPEALHDAIRAALGRADTGDTGNRTEAA